MSEREATSFHVYVIELDDSKRKAEKPAVYVGQSVRTPETRFEQHKAGFRASRHVRDHGVRLRPRLYAKHNPLATREAAEAKEAWLAARLRSRGYTVYGGH
jgi:hypothetical protein